MPITEYVILFFVFAFLTFVFSSIGIGGGIFYVPILTLLGYDFISASTASLFIIFIMVFSAVINYLKKKLVNIKLVLIFEPFSIAGGFFGGYASNYIKQNILYLLFSGVMIASAFLLKNKNRLQSRQQKRLRKFCIKLKSNDTVYYLNIFQVVFGGFLAGVFSGLLGIGGGVIKMPIMASFFGIPVKIAAATSSFMILFTSFAGIFGHILHSHASYSLLIVLGAAAFLGGQFGSRFMIRADKKLIEKILLFCFILISVFMFIKGVFVYF